MDELDRRELRRSGWLTVPMDNVTQDFVSDLIQRYLNDLNGRVSLLERDDSGIA